MTVACTTVRTVVRCGVAKGGRGAGGCLRVYRRRILHLNGVIRRVLSLNLRHGGSFGLGCREMSLGKLLSGVIRRRDVGSSGPFRIKLRSVPSEVVLRTSEARLCGVLDGVLSGTVGCSNSDPRVRVATRRHGNSIVVHVASGNVKVRRRRLTRVFSGFCQISGDGQPPMEKCNVKLFCIGAVVRVRGNAVQMRDRPKGKDYFVVALPRARRERRVSVVN